MYDGVTNYQIKAAQETWEEQEARLEAFAQELEEGEDKAKAEKAKGGQIKAGEKRKVPAGEGEEEAGGTKAMQEA